MTINSEQIYNILKDWNLWEKPMETGFPRFDYLKRLEKMTESGQVAVITGARRSGKSYLMRQLAGRLVKSGIDKNRILFINFEDPRFGRLDAALAQKVYETYLEYKRPSDKPYIFLDEIQEVAEWEKWVRTLHELSSANLIISGSNAKLLSRELSTVLTGRHVDLTVLPFSFAEFVGFRREVSAVGVKTNNKALLREYLEIGGFPEVVKQTGERKEILLAYFDDIVAKDLARRYNIRKDSAVKEAARYYFSNISAPTTFNSLAKFLRVSPLTAQKFAGYFENAYLLFFLKRFSFKVKAQEKSPRKVYAVDLGLSGAVGFGFSEGIGRKAENVAYLELLRRQFANPNLELYYWKDDQHHEVDFVLKEKTKVRQLIQVAWNLSDGKTLERELDGLFLAAKEFPGAEAIVITGEKDGKEQHRGLKIKFMSLSDWLLNNK